MPPTPTEMPYTIRFTATSKMAKQFSGGSTALEMKALFEKWGVIDPTLPSEQQAERLGGQQWGIQSFRFIIQNEDTQAGASKAGHRFPYHEGLAPFLLSSLFQSEAALQCLPAALQNSVEKAKNAFSPDTTTTNNKNRFSVQYETLSAQAHTLSLFDRLAESHIVRKAANEKDDDDEEEVGRLPITKRPEMMLSQGVVVSDELRALFFFGNQNNNTCEDDEEEEDDMFGMGLYGSGSGGLSKKELRQLYSAKEKKEFLYHVLWRCVAGGGAMNQFEDDFAMYRNACRWFYKQCIDASSLVVKEQQDMTAIAEETDHVVYAVQQIKASVFLITGLRAPTAGASAGAGQRREAVCALFPNSRDELSDHLNYCYMIVNPLVEEVLVWYRCC